MYFPEYNTGFLLYKSSEPIAKLFNAWLVLYDQLYQDYLQAWDQSSLRSVLWSAISSKQLSFLHLPSIYNLRTTKPWTVSRGSSVSIIHGRFDHSELDLFIDYLNGDIDCFRTWAHWLHKNPSTSISPRYDNTSYDIIMS